MGIFIATLIVLGIISLVIAFFAGLEVHECIPVEKLLVVQHFDEDQYMQIVDLSLLEEKGWAKLDQYFADIPFDEDDMLDAGFTRSHENGLVYWKVVEDTELIQVTHQKSYYWIWGRDDDE